MEKLIKMLKLEMGIDCIMGSGCFKVRATEHIPSIYFDRARALNLTYFIQDGLVYFYPTTS